MKILFIASDTNALGGIQQYNRKFLKCLKERGDEVALIELKGNFLEKLFAVFRTFIKSALWKPRVTVCAHINYSPIWYVAKKLFDRKYIICTHGVDVWNITNPLQRMAIREAKLITTVAEYTRDKILGQIESVRVKCQSSSVKCPIYLLYNPIDGTRFMPKEKSSA